MTAFDGGRSQLFWDWAGPGCWIRVDQYQCRKHCFHTYGISLTHIVSLKWLIRDISDLLGLHSSFSHSAYSSSLFTFGHWVWWSLRSPLHSSASLDLKWINGVFSHRIGVPTVTPRLFLQESLQWWGKAIHGGIVLILSLRVRGTLHRWVCQTLSEHWDIFLCIIFIGNKSKQSGFTYLPVAEELLLFLQRSPENARV